MELYGKVSLCLVYSRVSLPRITGGLIFTKQLQWKQLHQPNVVLSTERERTKTVAGWGGGNVVVLPYHDHCSSHLYTQESVKNKNITGSRSQAWYKSLRHRFLFRHTSSSYLAKPVLIKLCKDVALSNMKGTFLQPHLTPWSSRGGGQWGSLLLFCKSSFKWERSSIFTVEPLCKHRLCCKNRMRNDVLALSALQTCGFILRFL